MIIECPWRTVIVESASDLRMADGVMVIKKDESVELPICEIRHLVIVSNAVTLSVGLINALAHNNTVIVLCDSNYIPASIVTGLPANANAAGNILFQSKWGDAEKLVAWRIIVKQKIKNQAAAVKMLGLSSYEILTAYADRVDEDEKEGIEGTAARVYFRSLFGPSFIRHSDSEINSALNYGYVVVCTMFTRILTIHGYCSAIGIHHCSTTNVFNLSCDLMEPFRPFVDRVVYNNREQVFDRDYKKTLLTILHSKIKYGGKTMDFYDAAEMYTLDVLAAMRDRRRMIKEVCFVG